MKNIKNIFEYRKKVVQRYYLICKNCNGYYKLQEEESPEDSQNLLFWDSVKEVYYSFDICQCGGDLNLACYIYDYDATYSGDE